MALLCASATAVGYKPALPHQQRVSDEVCEFLKARNFEVGPCPRVLVAEADIDAVAMAVSQGTVLSIESNIIRPEYDAQVDLLIHLHEILHRVSGVCHAAADCSYLNEWTGTDTYWEEATVEACARDLLPAAMAILRPGLERMPIGWGAAYQNRVNRLRALTAAYTDGSWLDPPARSVRLWICRQPIEKRVEAITMMIAYKAANPGRQNANRNTNRARGTARGSSRLGPPDRPS